MNDEAHARERRPRVYLAAPLFSEAELAFNERLRERLLPYFQVYLPQEDGHLMVDLTERGYDWDEAAQKVFAQDIQAIVEADYVVAVLDGRTVDEGVAVELGFAHAHQKQCIALQTDPRSLIDGKNNPMVSGVCSQVFTTVSSLLGWAEAQATALSGPQAELGEDSALL